MHDPNSPHQFEEDDLLDGELEPRLDLRELFRLHPRLLLAALLVGIVMLPLAALLDRLGVWVLDISGGAAADTSVVVGMAGVAVTDFWGGGLVTTLTRVRAAQVAVAWGIVRLVLLAVLFATVLDDPLVVLPIQLVLAVFAAYAGARVARKQAALRRQIERERAAEAARREQRADRDDAHQPVHTRETADIGS